MKRLLKVGRIVIGPVIALALVAALAVPALAADELVPTTGEIGSGEYPPVIKAKWVLPDDDLFAPGVQIIPNPGTWNPETGEETEGEKQMECWVVVTDEEGIEDITSVQCEVIDSEGTLKWQKECVQIEDLELIEAAKQAAVDSGQLTAAEAADIDTELEKHEAKIYRCEGVITNHQPAGTYQCICYANDQGGATSDKEVNLFEVISIYAFAIDFNVVDFGPMKPCKQDWVSGNDVMEPFGANPPTIKNLGNDPFTLVLHFDPMVNEQGKTIEEFDATFMGETIEPIMASDWVTFTNKLERCQATEIDFSVHPPYTATSGTYWGNVTISIADPSA